jgi:TPR repeat protein
LAQSGRADRNDNGQDYGKARDWYEKAAEKGNDSAMNNLGCFSRLTVGDKRVASGAAP